MDILKKIENEEYLKDFITRSTYNSNAIEGNKLTLAETRELLYCDMNLKINADGRSINEAINHKRAMEYAFLNIHNYISNSTIENINDIINGNIKKFFLSDCGKKLNINLFLNMEDYENFEKNKRNYLMWDYFYDGTDIFRRLAEKCILFEKRHPFKEGNGRTGRILINYELIQNNIVPIVIEKENKKEYLKFLEGADIVGFGEWIKTLSNEEKKRLEYFELVKNQKQSEEEEER
ncbi:MAG: Fic family protein [Clostridiales bacterium]|nr:Fic family protein [Clostridiales bacterium]